MKQLLKPWRRKYVNFKCPEEVYLSEKLIELHPWAGMARLARTGGEANAVAIRIARAFSGRDKVAICGYHGWHDWYLSANLNNHEGLDSHCYQVLNQMAFPETYKILCIHLIIIVLMN